MKSEEMSESGFIGLKDGQDLKTSKKKILKSSNLENPDSDNKQGWEIKKLSEVAEYFNGLTYSPKDVDAHGTVVLRSSNIQNDELDFSDIVRVNAKVKEKLYVKDGDILMCSRNGSQRLVGKTALINNLEEPMTFGTFMMIIRNKYSPYLLWFFKTDEFKKQISGGENTMINQVTRYMLDEIKIPLPPLPEQQRIVSILDKAFAAIAKAKANAEQNLKNAKELFESYLQGVFENGKWEEKTLGEVCEFTQGIQRDVKLQSENKKDNQVRFLRIVDFTQGNEPPRYIDNPGYKYILNSNDVSLVRYGASTGFVCRGLEGALANNLFRVIPKSKKAITNDFLFVYLSAPVFQNVIKESMNGAAMPAISFGLIKDIPFPIISIKEQQTIVQKLDALSTETKKLEAIYQQKINDLEELKKSVLQKAFSGELRSPAGAAYDSEAVTPLADKKTIKSPERA